jgi:hypothetical protein
MKTKSQIRQWLLFFVLVAIALFLHVQYPIESVVAPAPDDSGMDSPGASNTTTLPKAVMPSKPEGLHGTAHAGVAAMPEQHAADDVSFSGAAAHGSNRESAAQGAARAPQGPGLRAIPLVPLVVSANQRLTPPHWIQL